MIIRNSAGHLYRVTEIPDNSHAWMGIRVIGRRLTRADGTPGHFYPTKAGARPILVRKAATTVVEN
jgi:hypothetical protein